MEEKRSLVTNVYEKPRWKLNYVTVETTEKPTSEIKKEQNVEEQNAQFVAIACNLTVCDVNMHAGGKHAGNRILHSLTEIEMNDRGLVSEGTECVTQDRISYSVHSESF